MAPLVTPAPAQNRAKGEIGHKANPYNKGKPGPTVERESTMMRHAHYMVILTPGANVVKINTARTFVHTVTTK